MKKLIYLILILFFQTLFSQSKITVRGENDEPIANANIFCNDEILGKTNENGVLEFKTKCKIVGISAKGYYAEDIPVDKTMEISLTKEETGLQNIQTVILEDKSDPLALAILKKVNENYKKNSPQSLDSYSFKSYEKISADLDEDSIRNYNSAMEKYLDSLKKLPEREMKPKEKKDSLFEINFMKVLSQSKMFMWERASEFLYSKKYGEKVNILDNRVSGLKQPIYEMMTLRSNRNRIPREIREENRSLYRFFLTDSLEIDGRDTYEIRFRQVDSKQPVNRRKFNGYIYVDAETYGLKKIESDSKKKNEGSITSTWKFIYDKWFLVEENFKMKFGYFSFEDEKPKKDQKTDEKEKKKPETFGNYLSVKADYFDFKTPIEEKAADFKGYTMDVKNSDGSLLEKYRTDSLSARELMTYEKIDSVGTAFKADQKINMFTSLMRGKFRAGIVDLDVTKIFTYNKYEHFRLGAAAKLNEKFNKYISPDAYFAYGFQDHSWKFGVGADVKTSLKKNSFFRAEYFNDVMSAGKFSENQWNFRMKLMNLGIDLNNDRFYHYEGFRLSYENDITNGITLNLSAKKTNEESRFDYNFAELGNRFDVFSTRISVKFSPNSRNIMTPSGKFTFSQNYPELYLNYEQGLKSFGGELNFSRYDAMFIHQFRTKLGVTNFRIYAGMLSGNAPIWYNFSMNGLENGKNDLNLNATSYLGFATMQGGIFYNDSFAGTHLSHRIPWYFRTFGKSVSSFDVVYGGIIGDMKHPEYHDFNFRKLSRLYNEVGLEWNNFLSTDFNFGFFYRVGYYNSPKFSDNFAVQIKFKLLGF
ncbi:MAG: DUF5686 family protein [Flavobacteriaceae bacterium]|nr:DUF5686 family protein [Flavobacteriaceae bacterium]